MNRNGTFRGMIVTAATAAAILYASSLAAVEVPRLTGRVSDHAGMISPYAKADIEKKLAELERTDSTQIAVLTVTDLQGVTIEEFATRVAEKWKIGQKKLDNGVIFLVAKNERKMRIEVGYGLEGRLTDLLAGRILDNEVKPSFKAGDYDQGFSKGIDGIILAVRGEYRATGGSGGQSQDSSSPGGPSTLLFFVFIILNIGMGAKGIVRGTLSGGMIFPLFFLFTWPLTLPTVLGLVTAGLAIGFILSLIGRAMAARGGGTGAGGWNGSSGGYDSSSPGGWDSGGGDSFSGGGGDSGGGGASSDW